MTPLGWVLLGVAFAALFLVAILPRFYENRYNRDVGTTRAPESTALSSLLASNEASWRPMDGSSIQRSVVQLTVLREPAGEPLYRTLRVDTTAIGEARWRLTIRFLLFNALRETVGLDDIHARVYERNVPTPTFMTVSYRGDVLLQQDNTILKKDATYSLESGDGFEMALALEVTRFENAGVYGTQEAVVGSVRTVFGLLVDYYVVTGSRMIRRSLPSDSLYMFEHLADRSMTHGTLTAVDTDKLAELRQRHRSNRPMMDVVQRLEDLLAEHLAFRPTPLS